jgi:hypothetical protein
VHPLRPGLLAATAVLAACVDTTQPAGLRGVDAGARAAPDGATDVAADAPPVPSDGPAARETGVMDLPRDDPPADVAPPREAAAPDVRPDTGERIGLVGYWPLDEGSGTVARDLSGNANHGNFDLAPAWTTGKFGGAVDFSAANSAILVPSSPTIGLKGAMSVALWINVKAFPAAGALSAVLSRNDGSGMRGYTVRVRPDGTLEFHVSGDCTTENAATTTAQNAIDAATWVHVVGVYVPGTAIRLYVNGALQGQATGGVPAAQCDNQRPLALGRRPSRAESFTGMIDDVRLYDRSLTDADVLALYNFRP